MKDNGKLIYINNLRILLTELIVMLHIAVTYGSTGSWYYYEHSGDTLTKVLLTMFTAVIQSFVLGFFFMISGYFTPGSMERKGTGQFLKGRFLHLGIPFFVYYFIINPSIVYILKVMIMGKQISLTKLFGSGPLWFVETLFIFNLAYSLWWSKKPEWKDLIKEKEPPGNKQILIYATILSLANYAVRIFCPVGKWFSDFQLAFYPGYVSLFIIGIIAYRNRWFDGFSESAGKRWLVVSMLLILSFPIIMVSSGAVNDVTPFLGGLNWQSLLFSSWESFTGTGLIAGLFVIFRNRLNRQGRLAKTMSDAAYTVYIIHAPVIVFFTYFIRNILIYPLLKFMIVCIIGVTLCFLTGHIIKRMPLVRGIL